MVLNGTRKDFCAWVENGLPTKDVGGGLEHNSREVLKALWVSVRYIVYRLIEKKKKEKKKKNNQ
jgi:hypothetical protein